MNEVWCEKVETYVVIEDGECSITGCAYEHSKFCLLEMKE